MGSKSTAVSAEEEDNSIAFIRGHDEMDWKSEDYRHAQWCSAARKAGRQPSQTELCLMDSGADDRI